MLPQSFTAARMGLIDKFPFIGHLSLSLNYEFTEEIPAAGTNGKDVLINPTFWDSLGSGKQETLLGHEILHVAFLHCFNRLPNAELDNIAADHAINLQLDGFSETGATFIPLEGWLCDRRFKGLSREQIYRILEQEQQQKQNKQGKQGDGTGKENPGRDLLPAEGKPEDIKKDIQEKIINAAKYAKKQGKLPSGIAHQIKDLINPPLPWREILQQFLQTVSARDDYNYKRCNRHYAHLGIYAPVLQSEKLGRIFVAVDTSGSCVEALPKFANEINAIAGTSADITAIICDAKIHQVFDVDAQTPFPREIKGGGGTSFIPVFDYLKDKQPAALVFLTDGDGDFPRYTPDYPVLWVMSAGERKLPFGQQVEIK